MAIIYDDASGQYRWDYEGSGNMPNDVAPFDPATGQALAPPPNSSGWDGEAGKWATDVGNTPNAPAPPPTNVGQFEVKDTFTGPAPDTGKTGTSTGTGSGNPGSATSGATERTSNPQLDALIAQMLRNQQTAAEERARAAEADRVWRTNMRANIQGTIDTNGRAVTDDDPIIQSIMRSFSASGERELMKGREALAARSAMQGLPTGAFDSAVQGSYDTLAQNNAAKKSNLMYDETNARQARLMQALGLGASVMTADENRDLNRQIAEMGTTMDKLRMDGSMYLGGRQLDLAETLGLGNMNLSNRQVDNQNTQFYDRLGADIGLQESLIMQSIIRELMGAAA